MSGWHHTNASWKHKKCAVCETSFIPKSGVHKFCSTECKGKWKYLIGKETTASQYLRISGNWKKYFQRLCVREGRSGIITADDCLEILQRQNGKCALSGVDLSCALQKGIVSKTNASLDRIVAGGSYSKDNVQLVCRAVNSFRADLSVEEFKWWCTQVHSFNERKE